MTNRAESSLLCTRIEHLTLIEDFSNVCFQDTIDENNGDLDVDYNTLNNMVYMGKVIKETIRLWGLNFFDRACTKDYYIPEINYTVPKGIFIKLRGCLQFTQYTEYCKVDGRFFFHFS